MVIQTNTVALRTYNAGRNTRSALSKNLEKLSSGYRVNRAADDAAGLAVSERIRGKVTELDRCQRNASEGLDLARTADAALQEINDMLKRARGLCIQAENGTYGDQELAAISGEMNQLFREIDRITAGSYHNTICLFRQGIKTSFHEEYVEHFTPVKDILENWGDLDFIEKDVFDEAPDAVPATVSFELDDSVDPADQDTMEGKALTVGSYTYYFTKSSYLPSGIYGATRVGIGATMEDTLENLVKASRHYNYSTKSYVQDLSAASIDGKTVTLKAALRDLNYQTNGLSYAAKEGNAEWANGSLSAVSPTGMGTLKAIDGKDASDNQPVYTMANANIVLSYTAKPANKSNTAKLTQTEIDNLKENTFRLTFVENNSTSVVEIPLGDLNIGGTLLRNLQGNKKTWTNFAAALRTAVKAKIDTTKYTVGGSNATITVTQAKAKVDKNSRTYFYTDISTGYVSSGSGSEELGRWTSKGVNPFTVKQVQAGGAEQPEKCTVDIADLSGQTVPFSFSVDGNSHLYYNPNDPAYTKYTSQSGVSLYTSADSGHRVSSVTSAQVANDILAHVREALGNASVTVNGSKLEITAGSTGDPNAVLNKLNSMFRSTTCTIRAVKGPVYSVPSDPVITDRVYSNQEPTAKVTFDLGSDPQALKGKGFSVDGNAVEFINSDEGGGLRNGYNDIDLKSLTSLTQVKDAILTQLNRYGDGYTATLSGTKLTISRKAKSMSVTDGVRGMDPLSKGGAVQFDGGANTGHSQKAIDFSSITEENLDTLMGKGFRINCATCSGEYINIFFCWKDDGSLPKSFGKVDPETGITRTIHNIPVELSKVTSGDKIVENIVEQVRPTLNHFTDLMVGDPPTILLAMEKRIGDVIFDNELKLGSVESGTEANFTYSVEHKLVPDLPEGDLAEFESAKVNIYVGSDPEPQLIPIHLPYIDLYHLRLCPPEDGVDLTAEDQDPAGWLGRIDRADLAISSARGTIGADYNRLEHAIQDLSNAHIQLSDAYSVIRDADMAELMKEQMKLQILMQAQQTMQAQANQTPQGVLRLMQ